VKLLDAPGPAARGVPLSDLCRMPSPARGSLEPGLVGPPPSPSWSEHQELAPDSRVDPGVTVFAL